MSSGHPLEVIREVLGGEGLCQCGCRLPTSQCPTALRGALQSVQTWHVGATNPQDEVLARIFEHTPRGARELEACPLPAKDPQEQIAPGTVLENFRQINKTVKWFVPPDFRKREARPLSIQTDSRSSIAFRVTGFVMPSGSVRHTLDERENGQPVIAGSLYEAHLAGKGGSPNTRRGELQCLAYLYSWAAGAKPKVDLEGLLLGGKGLRIPQIRAFSSQLKSRWTSESGVQSEKSRKTHNKILYGCGAACAWFIEQFATPSTDAARQVIDLNLVVAAQRRAWRSNRQKVSTTEIAPDLTDAEIEAIEAYLEPTRRASTVGASIATRDHLMWRLAIDRAMRMSEILALRVQDCPSREIPYFRIVRIEERKGDPPDPRGSYAPRPKTLSRDLGNPKGSTLPGQVNEYITNHRYVYARKVGRKRHKQFLLPHKFLLISRRGDPLSKSGMLDVAKRIRKGTGIPFHWHLARHAYFNRAYAFVAAIENPSERTVQLNDLVYCGGWEDPESLKPYSERARQERGRYARARWQSELAR
jgi:integrase